LLPWTIEGQDEVEIAYLLDKTFWGQGLATEAAQGILKYGFEQLKLIRLICMIDPENIASQRVAERIGMTFEKRVHEYEGDNLPFFIYSITRKNDV
jgi:ribosomal-protein-alanine N-acetyltransferase